MGPDVTNEYLTAFAMAMKNYFLFCGSAYLIFHLLLRKPLARRKIWQKPTNSKQPLLEIRRTIISGLLGKGPLVVTLLYLAYNGLIPEKLIYADISEHGWLYFAGTVAFDVLVFDVWFYVSHRFIWHSRVGYRYFHIIHHRSVDPTPFARNSVHPVEGFFNGFFHILPVFVMAHHPLAILAAAQFKGTIGIMGHLGYEPFWSGFTRNKLTRFFCTSVHHHLHHSNNVRTNFAFLINWDLIFGTLSPTYHDTFEATVTRKGASYLDAAADVAEEPAPAGLTGETGAPLPEAKG